MNLESEYATPVDYAIALVRTEDPWDLPGDFGEQAKVLATEVERLRGVELALKALIQAADTNPHCPIGFAVEHCEPSARKAVGAPPSGEREGA